MKSPDYQIHGALPASHVAVTFMGTFMGKPVTWEMQLQTLTHCRHIAANSAGNRCPFIEIFPSDTETYPIKVGLELAVIDEPAIRKTIIMIRNYKRLAIGRLEFCREADGA